MDCDFVDAKSVFILYSLGFDNLKFNEYFIRHQRLVSRVAHSECLQAGRSGDRIPVEERFSASVQTGPGAQTVSSTMRTGSFPGVKSGRGVTMIHHPLLEQRSRKSTAIPLLHLWAVQPVQNLSACTTVHSNNRWRLVRPGQSPRAQN